MSLGKIQIVIGVLGLIIGLATLGFAANALQLAPTANSVKLWDQISPIQVIVAHPFSDTSTASWAYGFSPSQSAEPTGIALTLASTVASDPTSPDLAVRHRGYYEFDIRITCGVRLDRLIASELIGLNFLKAANLGRQSDWIFRTLSGFMGLTDNPDYIQAEQCAMTVRIAKGTPNTIYWGARDNGLPMIVVWGAPLTTAPTPAPIPVVQTELTESVDLTSSDMGEQEGAAPTAPPAETPPVDLWMLILLAIAIVIVILAVVAIAMGWFT